MAECTFGFFLGTVVEANKISTIKRFFILGVQFLNGHDHGTLKMNNNVLHNVPLLLSRLHRGSNLRFAGNFNFNMDRNRMNFLTFLKPSKFGNAVKVSYR